MKKLSNYRKFSYGFADLCFIFMVTFSNTYYLVFFYRGIENFSSSGGGYHDLWPYFGHDQCSDTWTNY